MVVCDVCSLVQAKYKCPRCPIQYCSVSCFSNHGECTEKFYQNQVEEKLQSTIVNEEQRNETIEMLERLRIEELEEEDEKLENEKIERMEFILKKLQSGEEPNLVWLSLMEDEKDEFWKILDSGELGNLIISDDMVEPWYCKPYSNGLISDINDNIENDLPASILDNIPLLSTLLGSIKPSNTLQYNMIEIVYVYCFCTRLFVGQWNKENELDILESMLRISRVLNPIKSSNVFKSYTSVKSALTSVLELTIIPPFCNSKQFSIEIINDVIAIVKYKQRMLILLSHLYKFFNDIMNNQIPNSTQMKRVGKIKQKILFYLSWCNSINQDSFKIILNQLEDQYKFHYISNINTDKKQISKPSILSTNINKKEIISNTKQSQPKSLITEL